MLEVRLRSVVKLWLSLNVLRFAPAWRPGQQQNSLILAQPNFIRVLIINRNVSFKRKEIVDKLLNHENLME